MEFETFLRTVGVKPLACEAESVLNGASPVSSTHYASTKPHSHYFVCLTFASALGNSCFWHIGLLSGSQLSYTILALKSHSLLKSKTLKSQITLNYTWHRLKQPGLLIPAGEQTQQLALQQLMNHRNASGCFLQRVAAGMED